MSLEISVAMFVSNEFGDNNTKSFDLKRLTVSVFFEVMFHIWSSQSCRKIRRPEPIPDKTKSFQLLVTISLQKMPQGSIIIVS